MRTSTLTRMLIVVLVLAALAPAAAAQDGPRTPEAICAAATPAQSPETLTYSAAENVLDAEKDYLAIFCTTAGPVVVDLFEAETPVTVNNFVFLAQAGYYNNTNFHRVIAEFMAQGGDPTNTGTGGPGYQFEDEIVDGRVFDRPGLLAMANAGANTNGSQFFITTAVTDWLNGAHTIFGEVVAGQANVLNLRLRDPQRTLEAGTLLETVVIVDDPASVEVVEETLPPATRETVSAAFETVDTYIPLILGRFGAEFNEDVSVYYAFDEASSGVLETADVIDRAPADVQAALESYLADHEHEYRLNAAYTSAECDLTAFPISSFSYWLDAYPSAEAAAAALADPALAELQAAQGFTAFAVEEMPLPYAAYTRPQTECDADMVAARAFMQRGRFVTMQEIVISADNAEIAAFLPEAFTMPMFEDALNTVLRPELAAQ